MSSNFDTTQYEERREAAQKAGSVASSRRPRSSSFGYFAYGDAPGAIGGGIGVFEWFPSRNALLNHIAEHLTYENPGRHDTDPFQVHAAVKRTVERFKQEAPLKALIPKLNSILRTYSQLEWIGTLRDLKEGSGKYEKELRKQFREDLDSDRGSLPVARSEHAAFVEFLSQYGF